MVLPDLGAGRGRNFCSAGKDTGPASCTDKILKKHSNCSHVDLLKAVVNYEWSESFILKPGNSGK